MLLHELAHARTGDKGNIVTISLIAYRSEDFKLLEKRSAANGHSHFESLIDAPSSATGAELRPSSATFQQRHPLACP